LFVGRAASRKSVLYVIINVISQPKI